jgi:hypothetical protein
MAPDPDGRVSLTRLLALNRTVGIVLVAVLFFGLGEQLWSQFLPVLLQDQSKELAREARCGRSASTPVCATSSRVSATSAAAN